MKEMLVRTVSVWVTARRMRGKLSIQGHLSESLAIESEGDVSAAGVGNDERASEHSKIDRLRKRYSSFCVF